MLIYTTATMVVDVALEFYQVLIFVFKFSFERNLHRLYGYRRKNDRLT